MLPTLLSALAACTLGVAPPDLTDDTDDTDVAVDTDDSEVPVDTDDSEVPVDTDDTDDSEVPVDTDDTAPPPPSEPMIVEVCDPVESATRFVELHNPGGTTVDLDGWTLRIYANGASSPTTSAPLDGLTIAPGDTLVVGPNTQTGVFSRTYGASADLESGVISGNGDDAYALFEGPDLRDVYGAIGVDGTNEPWEHEDTCARRNLDVTLSSPVWDAAEWTIGGDPSPFDRD